MGLSKVSGSGIDTNVITPANLHSTFVLPHSKLATGAGSGLDADTLDNIQASSFLRSDQNDTLSGNLTVNRLYLGGSSNGGFDYNSTADTLEILTTNGSTHSEFSANAFVPASSGTKSLGANALRWSTVHANSVKIDGHISWHAGNDGAGSGLDADTIDGYESTNYLGKNATSYYQANNWIDFGTSSGKGLYWGGGGASGWHIYPLDASNMRFRTSGNTCALRLDTNGGTARGFVYVNNSNEIGFLNNSGNWQLRVPASGSLMRSNSYHTIWDAGNDGAGSGLDADLLDGQQGSYYLDYNNLTNVPAGGGSDADTVDNLHASSFLRSDADDVTGSGVKTRFGGVINSGSSATVQVDGFMRTCSIFIHQGGTGSATESNGVELTNTSGGLLWGGSTIWHSGNDGSGSGLDADALDGLGSGDFLRSNANDTYTGVLSISGSINNSSTNGSSGAILGNIEVGYGAAYNSISARSNNSLHLNYNSSGNVVVGSSNTVWHAGNDGGGSGLDADTVDGFQASKFFGSYNNASGGWEDSNRNFLVRSGGSAVGLCMDESDGTFGFQLYGDSGNYGFLQSNWGSWDIRKTVNGQMMLKVSGTEYTAWHSGNDGSGSGLDADTLDGSQPSSLLVGKATTLDAGTNYQTSMSTTAANRAYGMEIDFVQSAQGWPSYGTVVTAKSYSGGGGSFQLYNGYGSGYGGNNLRYRTADYSASSGNPPWTSFRQIWDSGNDGSGSGLDADTCDGQHLGSTSTVTHGKLKFAGVGGNSGQGNDDYAIYQEPGSWSNPFPDLNIAYHTGIKIGAHKNYNGTRFYNDSPYNGSQIFSVGDGDDHVRVSNNLYIQGSTAWHSGNDGSGSGLDADTLDGVQGSNYMGKTGSYWNANTWLSLSSTHGLYWPNNYSYHVYLSSQYLRIRNNNNANGIQIVGNNSSLRGYLYADNNNHIGLLNNGGSWSLKCDSSGNVTATGNVTAYSDIRIKKNIRTIDNALDKVTSMRGVYFDRKDTGKASVGVIAQEIEPILPEVVETQDTRTAEAPDKLTDLKTVSYGNIVGVLIEAIKEQQEQINTLKDEIQTLKSRQN